MAYRYEVRRLLECIVDDLRTSQPPAVDQLRAILQGILRVGADSHAVSPYFDNVRSRCTELYLFDFDMVKPSSCPRRPSDGSATDNCATHGAAGRGTEDTTRYLGILDQCGAPCTPMNELDVAGNAVRAGGYLHEERVEAEIDDDAEWMKYETAICKAL